MRIVIDSSFFVSLFLDRDEHHKSAAKNFEDIVNSKSEIITSTLFLPEVVGTIRRRTNDQRYAYIIEETLLSWIGNIIDLKELTINRMKFATEDSVRFGLKGADAVFVALAKEMGAKLLTFDGEMKQKVAGKIGIYNKI